MRAPVEDRILTIQHILIIHVLIYVSGKAKSFLDSEVLSVMRRSLSYTCGINGSVSLSSMLRSLGNHLTSVLNGFILLT